MGLLNSLPDDIIVIILSLFPLKSAVKTAVLSRRWRYLWTQIDSLEITFRDLYKIPKSVLLKLTSPTIRKFVVKYDRYYQVVDKTSKNMEGPFDGQWFSQICARNIEEIEITGFGSSIPRLPTCLFKTKSLVSLQLNHCEFLLNLPENCDSIDLPRLKKITVKDMFTSNWRITEKLLQSCSSLEDLTLIFHDYRCTRLVFGICGKNLRRLFIEFNFDVTFVIDTPKLEYLTLDTCYGSVVTSSAKALLESQTKISTCSIYGGALNSTHCVVISRLESFEIKSSTQYVAPIKLPYLTRLELHQKLDPDRYVSFLQILHCCPVLEILVCSFKNLVYKNADELSGNSLVPECLLTRIKTIEITTPCILHGTFKLIEFLLREAGVLELLIFNRSNRGCHKDDQYDELRFCKEIYECQRSSSPCQIEFSGHYHTVPKKGGTITDHDITLAQDRLHALSVE